MTRRDTAAPTAKQLAYIRDLAHKTGTPMPEVRDQWAAGTLLAQLGRTLQQQRRRPRHTDPPTEKQLRYIAVLAQLARQSAPRPHTRDHAGGTITGLEHKLKALGFRRDKHGRWQPSASTPPTKHKRRRHKQAWPAREHTRSWTTAEQFAVVEQAMAKQTQSETSGRDRSHRPASPSGTPEP